MDRLDIIPRFRTSEVQQAIGSPVSSKLHRWTLRWRGEGPGPGTTAYYSEAEVVGFAVAQHLRTVGYPPDPAIDYARSIIEAYRPGRPAILETDTPPVKARIELDVDAIRRQVRARLHWNGRTQAEISRAHPRTHPRPVFHDSLLKVG